MSFYQQQNLSKTQNQIVDVFMDLQKRLDSGSSSFLTKILPFDEDRQSLVMQDSLVLLQYIKQVVIFLVKSKIELEQQNIKPPKEKDQQNEYEGLIQKLEADIRQHIRIEQQLRLYAESTQSKYEDVYAEKKILMSQVQQLEQKLLESEKAVNHEMKQRTEGCETTNQRYKMERPTSVNKLSDMTNKIKVPTEPMEYKKVNYTVDNFENKISSFGIKRKKYILNSQTKSNADEYKQVVPSQQRQSQPSNHLDISHIQTRPHTNTKLHTSHVNSPQAKKSTLDKSRNSSKQEISYVKQSQTNAASQISSIHHSQQQLGYRSYSQEQNALGGYIQQQPLYRVNFIQQLSQQQ